MVLKYYSLGQVLGISGPHPVYCSYGNPSWASSDPDVWQTAWNGWWDTPVNDANDSPNYDLANEIARAIEFAISLSGRPRGRPVRQDIVRAITPAFAIDDLVLVGMLHMLSQIEVYTAALRTKGWDVTETG